MSLAYERNDIPPRSPRFVTKIDPSEIKLESHILKVKMLWERKKHTNKISNDKKFINRTQVEGDYNVKELEESKTRLDGIKIIEGKKSLKTRSNVQMGNQNDAKQSKVLETTSKKTYDEKNISESKPFNDGRQIGRSMKKTNFRLGFRADKSLYKNRQQVNQTVINANSDKSYSNLIEEITDSNADKPTKTMKNLNMLHSMRLTNFKIGDKIARYQTTNADAFKPVNVAQNVEKYIRNRSQINTDVINSKKAHFDLGFDNSILQITPKNANFEQYDKMRKKKFMSLINYWKNQQYQIEMQQKATSDFKHKKDQDNHFQTVNQMYQMIQDQPSELRSISQENFVPHHKLISQELSLSPSILLDNPPTGIQKTKLRQQTAQFRFGPVTRGEFNQSVRLDQSLSNQTFVAYNDQDNYFERHNRMKDIQKQYQESHFRLAYQQQSPDSKNQLGHLDTIYEPQAQLRSETIDKYPQYDNSLYQSPPKRCQSNHRKVRKNIEIQMAKMPGQDSNFFKTVKVDFDIYNTQGEIQKLKDTLLSACKSSNDFKNKTMTNFKFGFTLNELDSKSNTKLSQNQNLKIKIDENFGMDYREMIQRRQRKDNVNSILRERPRTIDQHQTCNSTFYQWIQPVPIKNKQRLKPL
ncbi:UNKNOWN [Stylonychia lemnae]|uniref:Uncharacterized protein n=1 Tax=Stylonychia lemnae TaxID=5949 RepID=A0A078AHE4_STYLE|nr:UNKNOWN [Stylonychia lemnae]|eukprot:CDW80258.1 UNKNOWN [Stylonychia lemnae]